MQAMVGLIPKASFIHLLASLWAMVINTIDCFSACDSAAVGIFQKVKK